MEPFSYVYNSTLALAVKAYYTRNEKQICHCHDSRAQAVRVIRAPLCVLRGERGEVTQTTPGQGGCEVKYAWYTKLQGKPPTRKDRHDGNRPQTHAQSNIQTQL